MFYKFSYNLEFPRRDGISIFAKLFEREGFVRFLEFELYIYPKKFWGLILLAEIGSTLSKSLFEVLRLYPPISFIRFFRPSFYFYDSKFEVFGASYFSKFVFTESICLIFWDLINFWSFFNCASLSMGAIFFPSSPFFAKLAEYLELRISDDGYSLLVARRRLANFSKLAAVEFPKQLMESPLIDCPCDEFC